MSSVIKTLFVGQKARLRRNFSETDVKRYSQLTKDNSPVYRPDEVVRETYGDRPIVPGLLTEGLINQVISEKLPGSACILLQKEMIFYHPVYIGDAITAELEVIDINLERNWVTQKVTCYNQKGSEVIKGQVVILILSNQN